MSDALAYRPAITALSVLRSLTYEFDRTETRIATGLRIGAAEHDAAYWSIATTMRSTRDVLSTVKDSLGLALSIVDAALLAADPVLDNLDGIFNDLLLARDLLDRDGNADLLQLRKIDNDITERITAIGTMVAASGFNGVNLLYRPDGAVTELGFPVGLDISGSSASVQMLQVDLKKTTLIDGDPSTATNFGAMSRWRTDPWAVTTGRTLFNRPGWGPSGPQPSLYPDPAPAGAVTVEMLDVHGWMIDQIREATRDVFTTLGTVKMRLEGQLDHANTQLDTMNLGIGTLVDSDMNSESTRLRAIEVQKELALRNLAVINSQASLKLELFRA